MTDASQAVLRRTENTAVGFLAGIFTVRMFGLFMLLPIFAVLGAQLDGATPALIGTAIGIYGLMQAFSQMPFGIVSDYVGRRPMLLIGLALFIAGGVVAALSTGIYGVIIGRALQGVGATGSVIMALIADVVREKNRTRAMALIGMSVGGSFILAMILSPILAQWLHLSGLFWLTAALGVVAFGIALKVPSPSMHSDEPLPLKRRFKRVLGDGNLRRLDLGILFLHLTLTAAFVVLPPILKERLGLDPGASSLLYLGVLVGGFIAMVPLIIVAERRAAIPVKRLAVLLLVVGELILFVAGDSLWQFVLALFLYFMGFNLLESLLPSMVGRAAPAGTRGTAMGVYSSSQYLGFFFGGQLGGLLYQWVGADAVFAGCAAVGVIWLLVLMGMKELPKLDNRVVHFGSGIDRTEMAQRLRAITGVTETVVVAEQRLALLRVDNRRLDQEALDSLAAEVRDG